MQAQAGCCKGTMDLFLKPHPSPLLKIDMIKLGALDRSKESQMHFMLQAPIQKICLAQPPKTLSFPI